MGHSNNIIRQKIDFYTLGTSPELVLESGDWDELACSLLGSAWFIQTIQMNAWAHFVVMKNIQALPFLERSLALIIKHCSQRWCGVFESGPQSGPGTNLAQCVDIDFVL